MVMGGPDVEKVIESPNCESMSINGKCSYLGFHIEPGKTKVRANEEIDAYSNLQEGIYGHQSKETSQGTDSTLDTASIESSSGKDEHINCCDDKRLLIKTILSGQLLSIMLCITGTAATALSTNYGIRTPSFYAFLMYTLLACTFGVYTLTRKDFLRRMKPNWWKYLLVSICDVEANYLLTKAYAFTTLTSVQLCDSVTIPTVMIVSFIFLHIRYKVSHYIGVFICISGAVCLLFTDSGDSSNTNKATNEIVGDAIALCAAVLYGISQVGQEYLVRKYSSQEFLGMIGIYGMVLSSIQVIAVERNAIREIIWTWQVGLIFASFAISQYFYYTVMPQVIHLSSATVVNLSLLTSDLYTLTVGLFLFDYKFSYLYFIAFGGIFIGLLIYNIKPTPTAPKKKKEKSINLNAITTEEKTNTLGKREPAPLLNGNMAAIHLYGSTSPILGESETISENSFKISGSLKDYIVNYTKL